VQERQLAAGRHHEQAVGLGHPAGHLGQELGCGDADRDRQADSLAHVAPQSRGDLARRAGDPRHPADIEERLVDRQSLDHRSRLVEHIEHRPARRGVRGHPRLDHDRLRAQSPGLPAAHRATNAARPGLVARGEHDPRPDDDGARAQARIVALLDRREEGVEIGVQDRGLCRHEHMFASDASADGGVRATRLLSAPSLLAQLLGDAPHLDGHGILGRRGHLAGGRALHAALALGRLQCRSRPKHRDRQRHEDEDPEGRGHQARHDSDDQPERDDGDDQEEDDGEHALEQ